MLPSSVQKVQTHQLQGTRLRNSVSERPPPARPCVHDSYEPPVLSSTFLPDANPSFHLATGYTAPHPFMAAPRHTIFLSCLQSSWRELPFALYSRCSLGMLHGSRSCLWRMGFSRKIQSPGRGQPAPPFRFTACLDKSSYKPASPLAKVHHCCTQLLPRHEQSVFAGTSHQQ